VKNVFAGVESALYQIAHNDLHVTAYHFESRVMLFNVNTEIKSLVKDAHVIRKQFNSAVQI